jgi:ABC-type nitrate/sulfonate/bicarbonate transport system permease component
VTPSATAGRHTAAWIRFAGLLAVVIALEVMCRTGVISRVTMIPPSEMVVALFRMLGDSRIDRDIIFTSQNVASAIALSIVGGFAAGTVIHALPRLRSALEPIFSAYYAVPTFVFYPLLIVAFGIGAPALIAMGVMFGIVAMIINTLIGLDRVPRVYRKTARILRLDAVREALFIRLPAALPYLVTGIKLSVSYSVIGIIAGEFILATAGIGKRISIAYNEFDNATMYGLMLFILICVVSLNSLLRHWERRLHAGVASATDAAVKPRRGDYLWLALGFIVLWQGLYYVVGADALATPGETIRRAFQFLGSAAFWPNVASTGVAFAYALLISLAVGLALGIWLGSHHLAGEVADPILSSFYAIPKITLYPVILLLFGLGMPAKIAFGVIHGLFPIAIFTMNGVRNVAQVYHKTAAVLGLSRWVTAKTILVPAALPEIVAGLRLGTANTLLGTLIGELFASTSGIGFILIRATERHNVADIISLALLIFIAAATMNGLLLLVEKRLRHAT